MICYETKLQNKVKGFGFKAGRITTIIGNLIIDVPSMILTRLTFSNKYAYGTRIVHLTRIYWIRCH